jgi:hypothetical protein
MGSIESFGKRVEAAGGNAGRKLDAEELKLLAQSAVLHVVGNSDTSAIEQSRDFQGRKADLPHWYNSIDSMGTE